MRAKITPHELLSQILTDEFQARFWSKITIGKSDECWIWNGATVKGYGYVGILHHICEFAHRVAWMSHHRQNVPEELPFILHSCIATPACCNPAHLRPGTHQDNMDDMVRQGRHIGCRKLTEEEVIKIRELYFGGRTIYSLAEEFGITPAGIWCVINKHWNGLKHFPKRSKIMPKGSKHHRARFTENQVLEMRRIRKETSMTMKEIAEKFGAPFSTVKKAVLGTCWKHL